MKIILNCLVLMIAAINVQAQGWRGIVPLRSSCNDVKEKLGITECQNRTYEVPDAKVSILFSDGDCSSGWNIAKGTVISFDVRSEVPKQVSELHVDLANYRQIKDGHLPGIIRYQSDDQSVTITVSSEGLVTSYFYGPSIKDEYLRCPPTGPSGTGSIKFDEYADISQREEEERLNNFAFQLRSTEKSFLGYILAYSGRSDSSEETHKRAVRARDYLVKRGIESSRLFIVEGGRREKSTIELFVTIKDTIPPTPRPPIP